MIKGTNTPFIESLYTVYIHSSVELKKIYY